jgi:hypothetical protein
VTLRLVSDNPEPGRPDYADIAAMLRQYAGEIEAGQYGDDVICALLVLETPAKPLVLGCGEEPSPYEMMGLFEAAKLNVFADQVTIEVVGE